MMNYHHRVVRMRAAIIDAVCIANGCRNHCPNQRENNVGLAFIGRPNCRVSNRVSALTRSGLLCIAPNEDLDL